MLTSKLPTTQLSAKTTSIPAEIVRGLVNRALNGRSYVTSKSRSRNSSTTLRAVRVIVVRPIVSMKVRCRLVVLETSGTEVWKRTLLNHGVSCIRARYMRACKTYSAPSGSMIRVTTRSYSTPSACFGPSKKGTLRM